MILGRKISFFLFVLVLLGGEKDALSSPEVREEILLGKRPTKTLSFPPIQAIGPDYGFSLGQLGQTVLGSLKGEAEDQYNFGFLKEAQHDFSGARYWFSKAAKQGHKDARERLVLLEFRFSSAQNNACEKNFFATQEKENSGYMMFQHKSGVLFQFKKNWNQVFFNFQEAASRGDQDAQYQLGSAMEGAELLEGEGGALFWYEKAARQGHKEAQHRLGRLKLEQGETQVYQGGRYWLSKAAQQGVLEAFYDLGRYEEKANNIWGLGGALYWYREGEKKGHSLCQVKRKELNER